MATDPAVCDPTPALKPRYKNPGGTLHLSDAEQRHVTPPRPYWPTPPPAGR